MIAIRKDSQMMYASADSGEYVWGTEFHIRARGGSPYFSGGACVLSHKKPGGNPNVMPDGNPIVIIYPDGKYREFPTGTKDAAGQNNDVAIVRGFVDGHALILRGLTWTFIDKSGRNVFPQLSSKEPKSNHRSIFTGKVTDTNMAIFPVRENRRIYYNAELEKYGYADANGAIVVKPQFDKATDFSEGLAAVMNREGAKEKWGFIDPSGKMVIPATYRLQPGRFKEGLAAVRIGEDDRNYEMTYIDKTGKRAMETRPWGLSEFTGGFAWANSGGKPLVINKEFEEVRDLTKTANLRGDKTAYMWITFPDGAGAVFGHIFAPDGTILFTCVGPDDGWGRARKIDLHGITEGGLMFCEPPFEGEPRLKKKEAHSMPCFINKEGEIVFYFEVGVEGFEGKTPELIKDSPTQQAKPAQAKPAQAKPTQVKPAGR